MDKVRVLVVDDSLITRKYLSRILEESGKIEVIDTATNGLEAIEKVKQLNPDVVTLDIEMPKMNGLEALERIMKEHPTPVVMVSTLTTDGAVETLKALKLGAVDYIPKNDVMSLKAAAKEARQLLIEKVVSAKYARIKRPLKGISSAIEKPITRTSTLARETQRDISETPTTKRKTRKLEKADISVVAIAASTGGPVALEKVFADLPKLSVPVLIVQHMPKAFTGVFAKSLDRVSQLSIKEAEDGEMIKPNMGYLAPGGMQMSVQGSISSHRLKVSPEPKTIYTPNADIMFESVANTFGSKALCVIMTGMGDDGYRGLKEVHRRNGIIIAQDKDSCVVWGMPRKPTQEGLADFVVPLEEIPKYISKIVLGR